MQKENYIITVELQTSRGNAKDLTAELDALREHKNELVKSLEEVRCIFQTYSKDHAIFLLFFF